MLLQHYLHEIAFSVVRLPANNESEARVEEMVDAVTDAQGMASTTGSVLIVDGDAGVRRVLGYILRDLNCSILTAADGESAIEVAAEHEPDVVVAEVRLPGMSGPELATKLRDAGHAEVTIVLMSAYPRPPRGAEDHFLYKPLRFERLTDIVRETVAAHKAYHS